MPVGLNLGLGQRASWAVHGSVHGWCMGLVHGVCALRGAWMHGC